MKALSFILISFLSSFGDTLFLAGVPLFFFQESGGSITETAFLPVAITLSVLIARRLIFNLNQTHPVKLTAYGEISMGLVELVLFAIFFFIPSKWVIILGTLPLAMIYNIYAPAKFFRIQEHFFGDRVFYLTTWQSAANRFGMLAAVFLSGWVVVRFGIKGILLIDSASFILFGLFMLTQRNSSVAKPSQTTTTAKGEGAIISKRAILHLLPLVSLSTLFLTWDRSSIVAITSKATQIPIDTLSMHKAVVGSIGILVGIILGRIGSSISLKAWVGSLFIGTLGIAFLSFDPRIATYMLYFAAGLISCISIPVQKFIYSSASSHGGNDNAISTGQWIYGSALSLFLIPIGYLIDKESHLDPLSISGILVALVGIAGGYAILKILHGLPK